MSEKKITTEIRITVPEGMGERTAVRQIRKVLKELNIDPNSLYPVSVLDPAVKEVSNVVTCQVRFHFDYDNPGTVMCKRCNGTGKIDDAEPGDIAFNEVECSDCKPK